MDDQNQKKLKRWAWRIAPVLIGAIGGFAYYATIGCVSGGCPITSNPWISTAYGAVIGLLVGPALGKHRSKNEQGGTEG